MQSRAKSPLHVSMLALCIFIFYFYSFGWLWGERGQPLGDMEMNAKKWKNAIVIQTHIIGSAPLMINLIQWFHIQYIYSIEIVMSAHLNSYITWERSCQGWLSITIVAHIASFRNKIWTTWTRNAIAVIIKRHCNSKAAIINSYRQIP